MIKGKKNVNITPCSEYEEYKEEHAVPRNDKWYARWERFQVRVEKLPEQPQYKPDKTMDTEFRPFHST